MSRIISESGIISSVIFPGLSSAEKKNAPLSDLRKGAGREGYDILGKFKHEISRELRPSYVTSFHAERARGNAFCRLRIRTSAAKISNCLKM